MITTRRITLVNHLRSLRESVSLSKKNERVAHARGHVDEGVTGKTITPIALSHVQILPKSAYISLLTFLERSGRETKLAYVNIKMYTEGNTEFRK